MPTDYSTFSEETQECIKRIELNVKVKPEQVYTDCQRLLKIAVEESSDALMGLGYYFFAEYYLAKVDADQVMYCLMEAIKYFHKAKMYDYLAKTYNMMGTVADSQSNKIMALEYYNTCIQYCQKYNIKYICAMAEMNVANILHNMGEEEKAIEYFKSANIHYGESGEMPRVKWNLTLSYIGLGYCYMAAGNAKEAEKVDRYITEIVADKHDEEIPEFSIKIWKAWMANHHGEKRIAIEFIEDVIEKINSGDNYLEYSDNLIDIAELLLKMSNYELLLEFLLSGQSWEKCNEDLRMEAKWYFYLLSCYEEMGMKEEYIKVSEEYFIFCEDCEAKSRETARKAIELRGKLNIIQQRQYDMMLLNEDLKVISQHDPMTGLANRTYLNAYLEKQLKVARAEQKKNALELMDIDCFKKYNDFYGHLAGDNCIEKVAMVLKSVENDKIFCARYGGDEFILVYYDMNEKQISEVAEKIKTEVMNLRIPHEKSDVMPRITVSQGIIGKIPTKSNRAWDYSENADRLLYQVKKSGKNGINIKMV